MKKVYSLLLLVIMIFIVSACTDGDVEENSGGEGAGENNGGESGDDTLVIAVDSEVTQIDPHLGTDIPSANVYHNKIFETLVVQDENMEIQSGLATEWERINDNEWEFRLREDVEFHDGEPFDANAVKANIDRVLDPELASPRASLFEMIEEVEIVDDYTVRLITEYPFAPLLANLAHYSGGIISPASIQAESEGEVNLTEDPVGTGPLTFDSWDQGNEVVLSKNDNYWGEEMQVEEVIFRVVTESSSRFAMIETGQAHIAEPISFQSLDMVEDSDNMELYRSEGLGIDYIGFNVETEPFDDIRVRQALSYAIDTEAIIDGVYNGVGTEAIGPIGPANFGYHPDLEGYGHDPERAQELLNEAGYEDGFDTTFWTNDDEARVTTAEIVQDQLSEYGINVEIKQVEWGAYLEQTGEGLHDMFILGWSNMTGDGDYNQYYLFHSDARGSEGNRSFYANEEVDSLIDEARQESDEGERLEMYHQAQEIEVEEAPLVPVRHTEYVAAISPDVEGFWMHPSRVMMLNDVEIK
ncbi:glutathione ABC transporter substrate-binding protein [Salinicoccus sp. RF5]|uniref:glutathione ABC transporter substrate-binding protein n=1 Tax=Salinicoccus sp. RF5 TaxID=2748874 RepID=UPI001E380BF0|nr:glutathione ABC transporter substrate-binding protein [Salinicoccus sp. RF5]MCC4723330.1 glutathione ABC transporter substrate-binding protein [Salinicoccus sp. RF5]